MVLWQRSQESKLLSMNIAYSSAAFTALIYTTHAAGVHIAALTLTYIAIIGPRNSWIYQRTNSLCELYQTVSRR